MTWNPLATFAILSAASMQTGDVCVDYRKRWHFNETTLLWIFC